MYGASCHLASRLVILALNVAAGALICACFAVDFFSVDLRIGGAQGLPQRATPAKATSSSSSRSADTMTVAGRAMYGLFLCVTTSDGNEKESRTRWNSLDCGTPSGLAASKAFAVIGTVMCFLTVAAVVVLLVVQASWNCGEHVWLAAERPALVAALATNILAFASFLVCTAIQGSTMMNTSDQLAPILHVPLPDPNNRWGFSPGAGASTLSSANATRVVTVTSFGPGPALFLLAAADGALLTSLVLLAIPHVVGVFLCVITPRAGAGTPESRSGDPSHRASEADEAAEDGSDPSANHHDLCEKSVPSTPSPFFTADRVHEETSEAPRSAHAPRPNLTAPVATDDSEPSALPAEPTDPTDPTEAKTQPRDAPRRAVPAVSDALLQDYFAEVSTTGTKPEKKTMTATPQIPHQMGGFMYRGEEAERDRATANSLPLLTSSPVVPSVTASRGSQHDRYDVREVVLGSSCSSEVESASFRSVFRTSRSARGSGELLPGLVTFVNTPDQSLDVAHRDRTPKSRRKHARRRLLALSREGDALGEPPFDLPVAALGTSSDAVFQTLTDGSSVEEGEHGNRMVFSDGGAPEVFVRGPARAADTYEHVAEGETGSRPHRKKRKHRYPRRPRTPPQDLVARELNIHRDRPLPQPRRLSRSSSSSSSSSSSDGSGSGSDNEDTVRTAEH